MSTTGTRSPRILSSLETLGASYVLIHPACVCIVSFRAILHNETTYPEPDLFSPQRFLNATSTPTFPDAAFGFGRRICPGRYIARDAVWIAIASILATFEIRKALDEKGNEVEPLDDCASGVVS